MVAKFLFAAVLLSAATAQQFLGGNFLRPGDQQDFTGALSASKMVIPSLKNVANYFTSQKLSTNPMDDSDLQAMEESVEALVVKGDDPANVAAVKSMTGFIVKTLIPIRERQLNADQQELDEQVSDIKECSISKARETDMKLHETMSVAEDHKADINKGKSKVADCQKYGETRALIKDAHCTQFKDAEERCMCHPDIVKAVGPTPACKKNPAIDSKYKACCEKFVSYKLHQLKCQNVQHDTKYAQRQNKIIMDKVCTAYSACYDKQLKEYKYVEKNVKSNEAHRQLEKLYKIKCLVTALDKGKVTQSEVKVCKEKKVDVKTIKYPEVPAKDTCVVPK